MTSSKAWFAPDAIEILRRDAAEWKRRALAAEGKLSGYRRLREHGEEIARAVCEGDTDARVNAIDSLVEELACLDIVDAPRDHFNQVVELEEGMRFIVRSRARLGSCSTLDPESAVIEVEALQPSEGKAIGLFFQVLQIADIAAAKQNETEPELSADHMCSLVPAFMSLASELGLLDPGLGITTSSLEAYVCSLEAERQLDAASTRG